MDEKREKYDRVWRLLLADAKGDMSMSEKVIMELFAQPDGADAFLELNAILIAFALKGLDAQKGGRQQTIKFLEEAIARGLDPDLA